jgi:hypothetical protein
MLGCEKGGKGIGVVGGGGGGVEVLERMGEGLGLGRSMFMRQGCRGAEDEGGMG